MTDKQIFEKAKQSECEKIDKFTDYVNKELKEFMSAVGWTFDKLEDCTRYFICPFDKGHHVPEQSFEKHLQACEASALGYTKYDILLPESVVPKNSSSTISISSDQLQGIFEKAKEENPLLEIGCEERILPKTSDRIFSDFTKDERRIAYDYAVSHTVKPEIGQDIQDIHSVDIQEKNKKSSDLCLLELLEEERNLKRRRAKHKGVHTNKKSHTEIMREVIGQQLETYTDYLKSLETRVKKEKDDSYTRDYNKYSKNNFKYKHEEIINGKDLKRDDPKYKHNHRSRDRDYSRNRSINYDKSYRNSEGDSYSKHSDKYEKELGCKRKLKSDDIDHKLKHKKHKKGKHKSTYKDSSSDSY